jgi:hypothetical protein
MKPLKTAALIAAALIALGGCKSWASLQEVKISINAPAKVARKGEFTFTVNGVDRDGQQASFAYQWKIQWVGVEGSTHKGKSGANERITVKGGQGKAMLVILGYDTHETWGEIANHTFDVE